MCARWRVWRAMMLRALTRELAACVDPVQHLDRRRDRRQRVAQLVAEHRQELVLRAVRGFGLEPRRLLALDQRGALLLGALLLAHVDGDADHLLRRAVVGIADQHPARQPARSLPASARRRGSRTSRVLAARPSMRRSARPRRARDRPRSMRLDPVGERALGLRRIEAEQLRQARRPGQQVRLELVVEEADVAGLLRQIHQVLAFAQPLVGARAAAPRPACAR